MVSQVMQLPISSKNVAKPENADVGGEKEQSFDELLGQKTEVRPEKPIDEQEKEKNPDAKVNMNVQPYLMQFVEQFQPMMPVGQKAQMPVIPMAIQPNLGKELQSSGNGPIVSQSVGVPVVENANAAISKDAVETQVNVRVQTEEVPKAQSLEGVLSKGQKKEIMTDGVKTPEAEKKPIASEQTKAVEPSEKPVVKEAIAGRNDSQVSEGNKEETVTKDHSVLEKGIFNETSEHFTAGSEKIRNSEAPVKETVSWSSSEADVNRKNLSEALLKNIASGKREFELQLEPLNLGKIAIKISYEAGKTSVSIICNSAKTLEAMAQNARELGTMLEVRLGAPTTVLVDKSEPDYLNQQQQQQNQQGREEQADRSSREKERKDAESMDFLQQLRLGMVG